MKTFILGSMLLAIAATSFADDNLPAPADNPEVKETAAPVPGEGEKTGYTFQEQAGGDLYDIYISPSGSCFIYRISNNTGKPYKYYLSSDISVIICDELGREYKGGGPRIGINPLISNFSKTILNIFTCQNQINTPGFFGVLRGI